MPPTAHRVNGSGWPGNVPGARGGAVIPLRFRRCPGRPFSTHCAYAVSKLSQLTARPEVSGGKSIIQDMWISVEMILSLLTQDFPPGEILDDYPDLEPDDIRACTACGHAVIAGDTLAAVSVGEP